MPAPGRSPAPRPIDSIAVVTPCYNAAPLLEETIESVVGQRAVREGRIALDYWVVDGGSSDGTAEILDRYARRGVLRYVSERDTGMYDAVAKGFERARGDVCSYLNAGDLYHPTAFEVVKEVMERRGPAWLTGYAVFYNDRSQVIDFRLPHRFRRRWIRRGFYGRLLPCIQQESTFWRRELLDLVDFGALRTYRYAGDFYLWHSFAAEHDLTVVAAHLGGFKVHEGQLSSRFDAYQAELARICGHSLGPGDRVAALVERVAAALPHRFRPGAEGIVRWGGFERGWGPAGD